MSQEQPQRSVPESVKYGDVFDVSGQLASQPIAPQDASALQAAEAVYGQTLKGGPAAALQAAANFNEQRGVVDHNDMTDVVAEHGATIVEVDIAGYRVVTESVGGQVVGRYAQPVDTETDQPKSVADADSVTIGEALEATALAAGDKPVDQSDAAAIQAAEVRATGLGHLMPGGVGAEAQSAVAYNMQTTREEEKATLGDVLTDATEKLAGDRPATREDAEGVIFAEIRNKQDPATHPGGVAAAVAAAARLNKQK